MTPAARRVKIVTLDLDPDQPMLNALKPAPAAPPLPASAIDAEYRRQRRRVFIGIFAGYAAYYLVRNNLPLLQVTYDGPGPAGMVLELSSAPLKLGPPEPPAADTGPKGSKSIEMTDLSAPWKELETRLTELVRALSAAQAACPEKKACYVPAATILAALNGPSGTPRWKYCPYTGPGAENLASVGFWLDPGANAARVPSPC